MSNLLEAVNEFKKWQDEEGLIGNKFKPEIRSSGNGILETAFAFDACKGLYENTFALSLISAVNDCFEVINGDYILLKNKGRYDQITHDDLIGAASMHPDFARCILVYSKYNLFYTNTGKLYWNAISRFYLRWYYKKRAYKKLNLFDKISMAIDLFLIPKDSSGLRLHYLKLQVVDKNSYLYKRGLRAVARLYGSMSGVHLDYYKNNSHPNVKYCKEL